MAIATVKTLKVGTVECGFDTTDVLRLVNTTPNGFGRFPVFASGATLSMLERIFRKPDFRGIVPPRYFVWCWNTANEAEEFFRVLVNVPDINCWAVVCDNGPAKPHLSLVHYPPGPIQ